MGGPSDSSRRDEVPGWTEVAPHLDRLLGLPAPERAHELDRLSASQPALGARLSELLAHRDAASREGFLDFGTPLPDEPAGPQAGTVLGGWELVEPVGEGGMGLVWRARRSDGRFEDEAAVKLLRRGAFDRLAAERFRREGAILARLQHPGIARLFDAGLTEQGIPYLVLEFVRGERLDVHADARHLPLRARLDLMRQVLDAVAAAHAQLVIHRDLKPSNILVDESGRTRLLDFGIARLLPGAAAGDTALTRAGTFALTPRYAAPEQFEAAGSEDAGALSTATDVYTLGVVLHELLTGVHPAGHAETGLVACLRAAQAGPQRLAGEWALRAAPGAAPAEDRAQHRGTTPRALRGDLDAILLKALQPRPADRYASVEALADDLQRHLHALPVRARPAGALYRLGKQLRRHAWAYGSATALALALTGGATTTWWKAREARAEAARANAVQRFVLDIFRANSDRQPDPQRARETTARQLLDQGSERLAQALADSPQARAEVTETLAQLHAELGLTERAVKLREDAVALAEEVHGPASAQVVDALLASAGDLNHLGRLDDRERALARAQAIVDAGPDRPSRQRALLHARRAEYEQVRDLAAAMRHADLAVQDAERLRRPKTLYETLQTAGAARLRASDIVGARERLARAVAVADACACLHPSETLRGRVLLAETQSELLEPAAAERTLRRALADAVRTNGPGHLDTLQVSLRLGSTLVSLGRPDDAVALLEPLRAFVDGAAGADEFTGPHLLHALGHALSIAGRDDEAIATLRRAIELRDRARAGTPFAASLRETLARALTRAERLGEAEVAAADAERIHRSTGARPGETRWERVAAGYVQLHLARGELEAARRRADEAPPGLDAVGRPTVFDLEMALIRVQIDLETGRDAAAGDRLRAVRAALAPGRRMVELPLIEARRQLLCGRWALAHAPAQAGTHFERSLALRRQHLPAAAAAHAEAQQGLARAGALRGQPDPAGPC